MRLHASCTTQQYKGKNVKVLEVVGCCSSVARALVAKARGSGFNSPATTEIPPATTVIFHILPSLFLRPV